MDELLKKLLEAEVLTEETKTGLETAFKKQIQEAAETARMEATVAVTAELNEKWIIERDTLIEALDAKVSEVLAEEIEELKADIQSFRDLEVEYAEKIVEAKEVMAETLKSDMAELIEKLDTFLEIRLATEIEELREDLEQAKKKQFGQAMFEAFVEEYEKNYATPDSAEGQLQETKAELESTQTQLREAQETIAKAERSAKLSNILSPLQGRSKEMMEAILHKVDTAMLEDAYKHYIGKVLVKESAVSDDKTSEKEDSVLAEGEDVKVVSGKTVTGDDVDQLKEEAKVDLQDKQQQNQKQQLSESEKARLRTIGGIIRN
jgi:hypothetical protein